MTELPETIANQDPSPLELAIGAENLSRYEAAVDRLTQADQEAIIGRIELQYTYDELAVVLGKPSPDAARMAVTRALKRLAEEMRRGADDVLARAIDGIADGARGELAALHGLARSDDERAELKWLQVLGELANVHRSAHEEIDDDRSGTTRA